MTSIGDILAGIFQQTFTDPRPCPLCHQPGPTYTDREKGTRYCLPCLESAVKEAEAELRVEELTAEWLYLPLEDKPEDAETVALGRAALA